jgi:hypothetical protein
MMPTYSVGFLMKKTMIGSMIGSTSYYPMTNYHDDDSFVVFCFFPDFSRRMTRKNKMTTTMTTRMLNWNLSSYLVSSFAVLSWAFLCEAPDCLPPLCLLCADD